MHDDTDGSISTLSRSAPKRERTPATIALLALMVAMVVSGFCFIAYQQSQLVDLRESTRLMRMARQALMEADASILDAMVRRDAKPDLDRYVAAVGRLETHRDADFPVSATFDGKVVTGLSIVASLRSSWPAVVSKLRDGAFDDARATYIADSLQPQLTALTQSYFWELDAIEVRYNAIYHRLEAAILAVLLLQIATGAICIFSVLRASQSGARATESRTVAMNAVNAANASRETANASREQLSRLFAMTDMLQSCSDQADSNAVLRSTAMKLLPGFSGALYVFNNSRDRLGLSTSWGRDHLETPADAIGLKQCWAMKRGKPHINDPKSDELCCEHHTVTDCALEIPMTARGEIHGLLQIYADGPDAVARLKAATEIGSALADAMSLALANSALRDQLKTQALRDPLTGLYNRRYMEDTLQRVIRLAERERHDVSVIMIDLDHFKRLNDQHGHAKGDSVLRDAAAILINQSRESDVACRYGGEELIVVLPNCGIDQAMQKAENLRASIAALSEPEGAQVSASFGVAAIPTTSVSATDLLGHADAALYRAKEQGRNRVVRAAARSGVESVEPGGDAATPRPLAAE